MSKQFEVKVRFTAEDDATVTVNSLEKSVDGLNKTTKASEAAFGVAEAAVGAFIAAMKFSIQASNEQEDALVRLGTALNLRGVGEFKNALIAQAEALQLVTRYSDDAIQNAQALLATYGVAGDSLATATQATVDLAAALGIDLQSAAAQVGGAFNGITRGLEKLVPQLKSVSEAGFDGAENIELLAKSMDGLAEATSKTTSGEWAKISNQIGELGEKTGDAGKKVEYFTAVLWALNAALPVANRLMEAAPKPVEDYGDAFAQLVKELEASKRIVTEVAQIQDRATRIMVENATAMSEAQRIAHEYGLTLQSEVAAAEQKRIDDMARLNDLLRETGDSLAKNAEDTDTATEATNENTAALAANVAQQQSIRTSLQATAQQVIFTAQAFEYLARTQGISVAVEQAVDAGGRIINAGSNGRGGRVTIPGGGTRLIHPTIFGSFGG